VVLLNRIRSLRNEKGLTQSDLAKLLNVSDRTIGYYENGQRDPDTSSLKILSEYFEVSVDFLLGLTEFRTPADRISQAIGADKELLTFWEETKDRENVQLLFKQIRTMSDKDINQVLRIIKAIEDEEDREGS